MSKIFYESFSTWGKILFMLALLLIVIKVFETKKVEGFALQGYTEKTNENLFDPFYSEIYDYLAFSDGRNEYEVNEIISLTNPNKKSVILDIGCGTGNIVNIFHEKGYTILGVDQSKAMVKKTMTKYPHVKIITGNVLKTQLFPPFYFTHILCLYFTIYYINNKTLFFENVFDWLKPGGYFVLHLVNRDNFSPVLPMNSYQRGNKNGKSTKIQFDGFDYESTFELSKSTNQGIFNERFKTPTGETRKNKHTFYMEDQKTILLNAQSVGFIVQKQVDMKTIKYDYQYLYILSKPN